MYGRIIKNISNLYTVYVNGDEIVCNASGKLKYEKITPLVGDYCEVDVVNKYIMNVMPRTNELIRPRVANIDIALIITSVKKPDLSLNLLDKLLTNIMVNNIKPIICFTKVDLLSKYEYNEFKKIMNYYKRIGITTIINKNKFRLKRLLKNKTVVLTGQTGAGKSTLINNLDKHLNIKTDEISISLGRGKHTTRHVEIYPINSFYVVDTPGFSSLDLNDLSVDDIKKCFIEFSKNCPFKDCLHKNEKECKVKEQLNNNKILKSRYDNYLKQLMEVEKCK